MPEGQGPEGQANGQGTEGTQHGSNDTSGQAPAGAGGQAPPTVPDDFDPQRAMATILAQRQNEQALKQQLQEAQARIKAVEDAEKTELQRATERAAELEKRIQDMEKDVKVSHAKEQVAAAAVKLGFTAPELAYRLIDLDALPEKDGKPDAEGALRDLLKQYPTLATGGSADGGAAGRPPARKGDMNSILRSSRGGKQ